MRQGTRNEKYGSIIVPAHIATETTAKHNNWYALKVFLPKFLSQILQYCKRTSVHYDGEKRERKDLYYLQRQSRLSTKRPQINRCTVKIYVLMRLKNSKWTGRIGAIVCFNMNRKEVKELLFFANGLAKLIYDQVMLRILRLLFVLCFQNS